MTLNNPKPTFQGQAILWRWISPKWLRHGHSYYERGKGTAIYLCHFQWPWTNPNPVFKVTPLVGAKYLINGYRYGHSYYRPEQTNTQAYTRNSIILSLTTVTDRQKSPVFCCKKSGNPRCLSDLSQNVLDALSCRRQSFRQVWYKSAVDCTEMLTNVQKSPIPQWWRTWKSDPESTRGSRSPPKVPHFQRVTSCPCLPSLVDIRFHVRQLYCLQNHRRNDRTAERSHVLLLVCVKFTIIGQPRNSVLIRRV